MLDIINDNHTDLKGAIITSSQSAEENMKNSFTTATLNSEDITNYASYKGESIGLELKGGYSNSNAPANSNLYNPTSTSVTQAIGYGEDKESQTSITHSGINTTNITISDKEAQLELTGKTAEETIAQIHTTTTTDQVQTNTNALKNNFDADAVQSELDIQVGVTKDFNQNATTAINTYVKPKQQAQRDKIKDIKEQQKEIQNSTSLTTEQKQQAYNDLEDQKTQHYKEIYDLEYQRILLSAITSGLVTADILEPALYGSAQGISTLAREESLRNSRLSPGIIDPKTGLVISNVSEDSSAFDGVKLGGTRLDIDTLCGEGMKNCINDGKGNLEYDDFGRVQWNSDPKTGAGMSMETFLTTPEGKKMAGLTGGIQGIEGTFAGIPYGVGNIFDIITEAWGGSHDYIGGQLPGFYDAYGNTRSGMSDMERKTQSAWTAAAIPITTPLAIPNILPFELWKLMQEVP